MATNWKQLYAKRIGAENQLKRILPNINNNSGIYIFWRFDEIGNKVVYIGQAKKLLQRLVSHLLGYSQHIDISLKKRKLKPNGEWFVDYYECPENELDNCEKAEIKKAMDNHYILYNVTAGGQGEGKTDINERKPTKTYTDGLKQGYENCHKYINELFKYFDFRIKENYKTKDGSYSKVSLRKYEEFIGFIKNESTD